MTKTTTVFVQTAGSKYTAELMPDGTVIISRNSIFVGKGRWSANACRVVDCAADLGDEMWERIDEELEDALGSNDSDGQ